MSRSFRSLATVVALGAAAVACGGERLPLDSWVIEANSICSEFQRDAELANPGYAGLPVERAIELNAELAASELRSLRELGRPQDRGDDTAAYIDALNRRAGALLTWSIQLSEDDGPASRAVPDEVVSTSGEARELAAQLGLDVCHAGVEVARAGPGGLPAPSFSTPSVPDEQIDQELLPEGVDPPEAPPPTGEHGIPPDETVTQDQ